MVKCLCLILLLWLAAHGGTRSDALEIHWTPLPAQAGGGKGGVRLASGEILATREQYVDGEHRVVCARSVDRGETWHDLSIIARQHGHATVGDGHLLQLPNGEVLFSYRHNLLGQGQQGKREYSIRVAVSRNGGKTWKPHSIVATSAHDPTVEPNALRGLWSSFLLLTRDGALHCVYDDEDLPHRQGFLRHQWLTMKTWDDEAGAWVNPVTVSRAHNPSHLSREGMPSIVELPSGRLICAFETVQPKPPHANVICTTTSDDGGKNWSWKREERRPLFPSPDGQDHLSVSPWLTRLSTGELFCVFATDEDRDVPGISGTPPPQLNMDIKYAVSTDDGQTWSRSAQVISGDSHRTYMPGVIHPSDGTLLVTFLDYAAGAYRSVRGIPKRDRNIDQPAKRTK